MGSWAGWVGQQWKSRQHNEREVETKEPSKEHTTEWATMGGQAAWWMRSRGPRTTNRRCHNSLESSGSSRGMNWDGHRKSARRIRNQTKPQRNRTFYANLRTKLEKSPNPQVTPANLQQTWPPKMKQNLMENPGWHLTQLAAQRTQKPPKMKPHGVKKLV